MGLTVVTPPAIEPLTRDQAKLHLKVETSVTADDDLIDDLIQTAREWVEEHTFRATITRTLEASYDRFPPAAPLAGGMTISEETGDSGRPWNGIADGSFRLRCPPLLSVTSIKYIDTAGVEQTLPTTEYTVDIYSEPGRISPAFGKAWPGTRDVDNAVKIRFAAGYGAAAANVPSRFKTAMRWLIGHYYENREPVVTGTISSKLELAVTDILGPLRMPEAW